MTETHSRLALSLVWLLIILYIVNFGTLSILKHEAFKTHAADLGNMDQPIWNTLHGHFVEETKDDGSQGTRLTDHFEPVFALVSLSFLIYDNVASILIFQTVVIALGALPVFWLARAKLRNEWVAVVFAAVYLLFPALQAANLTEFHAVPLAVAPLLFAFHYIEEGKYRGVWPCALLALSVKEEIALLVFMVGLYVLFVRRERLQGALLALISLAWFAVATFVIIPYYSPSGNSIYVGRYASLGGSFGGMVETFLSRPLFVLGFILTAPRLAYLAGLLASVGFLSLFSPLTLLLSAPLLAANVLSDYAAMYSGEFHYSAPLVPFFVISAVCGAAWVIDRLASRFSLKRRTALYILAGWALLWSVGYQHLRGFTPLAANFEAPRVSAHHRLFSRFAAQIPPQAIVSTTPPLFPHLSHRRVIYLFPVVKDAEYVLLDVSGVTDMHPHDVHSKYLELVESGDFGLLDASDGYILLQRGLEGRTRLPDEFYNFARVANPQPQYPMTVEFGPYIDGPSLRLLGFDLIDDYKWRWTRVRLYCRVLRKMESDLWLYPFFLDEEGRVIEDTTQRPMVVPIWYPTSRWRVGEVIVTETVPWNLGHWFSLALGVLDGDDWSVWEERLLARVVASEYVLRPFENSTWVRLLSFERRGARLRPVVEERLFSPPPIKHPLKADLGHQVALWGYDLNPEKPRPGQTLRLTLYWQALTEMGQDYTVFVHLLSPDGYLAAQHDSQPPLPTSAWMENEVVADEHTLTLDASLPEGDYQLEVGIYLLKTLERLPLLDEMDREIGNKVILGTVQVGK